MSFYKRYELARMIREGDVKTFSGFQAATRRPIYLHLFGDLASHPTLGRLWQMVKQAEEAGQVIEAGEFAETYYVVTDPIDKFTTLRDYLEANPPTVKKKPSPPAAPAAPPPIPVRPVSGSSGSSGFRQPEPRFPMSEGRPLASATPPRPPVSSGEP